MADNKNQSALNLGQNINQVGTNLINTASSDAWGSLGNKSDKSKSRTINGMDASQLSDEDFKALKASQKRNSTMYDSDFWGLIG